MIVIMLLRIIYCKKIATLTSDCIMTEGAKFPRAQHNITSSSALSYMANVGKRGKELVVEGI